MIKYLESNIMQSIDSPDDGNPETDDEFHVRLSIDSNNVAYKKQVHSSNHNAACFEKGQGKDICRFGMPRELCPSPMIDDLGVIQLTRNHG